MQGCNSIILPRQSLNARNNFLFSIVTVAQREKLLHQEEKKSRSLEQQHSVDTSMQRSNEENNAVTGQLSSLSPVVAAVLEDGTFDALYLQVHPLDGVVVEDASFLAPHAKAATGQEIDVGAAVKNLHRTSQSYAFVVQIEDENGHAVYIDWLAGPLLRGETKEIVSNWTPSSAGNYTATILILDRDPASPESANPIAQKVSVTTLNVTDLDDANGINGEQG